MANLQAPTEEDIKIMVINTVNHWREQRQRCARKLAEYDELLRKIGIDPDQEFVGKVEVDEDVADDQVPTSTSQEIRIRPGLIDDLQQDARLDRNDQEVVAS